MADISNISLFGTNYKIKDEVGRTACKEAINNLKAACQEAFNNLDNLSSKKFVFVGDSYAQGYTPDGNVNSWIDVFTTLANITNYTEYSQGGTGFATTPSFTSLISSVAVDPEVDYIIVGGGYNDNGFTTVPDAIKLFYDTARIKYPNAKIYVGFFGWTLVNHNIQRNLIFRCSDYKQGCEGVLNLFYLYGVENVIFNNNNYSSDGYHPNQNGQNIIAHAIYQAFCRGSYAGGVIANYDIPNTNPVVTNAPIQQLTTKTYNGVAQMAWQQSNFSFNTPQSIRCTGVDRLTAATIPRSALLTTATFGFVCSLPVIYLSTESKFYCLPTYIFIDYGTISLVPVAVNAEFSDYLQFQCTAIQLAAFSFSFNIWGS